MSPDVRDQSSGGHAASPYGRDIHQNEKAPGEEKVFASDVDGGAGGDAESEENDIAADDVGASAMAQHFQEECRAHHDKRVGSTPAINRSGAIVCGPEGDEVDPGAG
jgi:hypothetical protein